MKNQRKWFNGLAALLLVGQVVISATGTFAQGMLNDKTSHAATVSKDLYFQDEQGKRVSSINSKKDSTNTIYIKDTNTKDTSVTIDLPAGIDFDQKKTDKLIESEKSNESDEDNVKVTYNDNTRKVTIDFLAAKEAIDDVVAKKQAVSQAQAALLSLKNNDNNKSEVQVKISDMQAEVKKAQQALAEAQTEASNTEKMTGITFVKKSKTDEVLKAKTVRDNKEIESESLNIREPKTDKQSESTATTESTDDSASDAKADKKSDNNKSTFEGPEGGDIPSTLGDGTAIPAPPASSVDLTENFSIPNGASDAYFSSKYHQAAIITDNHTGQHGGVWGKSKVDLTRDWNSEMYVYMMVDGSDYPADGITFTLQGDSRGDEAIGHVGSGLGVYPELDDSTGTLTDGIKNALSIEFDPFYNYNRGSWTINPDDSSRELGVDKPTSGSSKDNPHTGVVATNSDISIKHDDVKDNDYSVMQHHNVEIRNDLVQNKWQKFSVKWDAARQNLIYTYGNGGQQTYHVPNVKATFGGNIVTYGYTGSTGEKYQHQYVSFSKLPQSAAVHVKYKDIDTGKEIDKSIDLNGEVGQNYTTEQKDFSSQQYSFVRVDKDGTVVPSPVSGTFTKNDQTVTYWYKREAASPVVEKSVKDLTNGNDLNKVRVGDTLEYTINATNKGKGDWNNVVVSDTIPEGLDDIDTSKVVATRPDGSIVPTSDITYDKTSRKLIIKNIGTLKPGESVKIVFPAKVNGDAVGKSIANVAMADGENPDGSTTGGSDDESVTPPDYNNPKPKVNKTVKNLSGSKDINDVRVGDTLEYTIDTTNVVENSILKNIVVSDDIPEGLDLDQSSVKAYGPDGKEITGAQVSYKDGQLVVSGLGDLKYNEHIKVVFQAKVNKDAIGKNIVNIADVTGENPDGSTTGGNGTDSTPIPDYRDPKPEVKKSVKDLSNNNNLDKVRVGDDLEYTIDTTNTAKDSILKNVVVSDKIPEGLDIDLASVKAYGPDGKEITGAQVSYKGGQLVVSGLGDLKYNEHIKVVFTAKVNEKAVGNVIENIADVTGENPDGSTTGGNGTDSTPVPDYKDPKPEVKKSVKDLSNNNDLNKVRVGDDLEYTIDTTNTAKDSILKNVVVSDKIPDGLDLDQSSVKAYGPDGNEITEAQVSYENGQLVVSNLGDLKYNEHIKVVFTAKVNEKAVGNVIENIADVTGENPDGSTTGDKGTDSTPTPDYNNPKPEVKKSVKDLTNGNDLNKVRVGDDLEYTIDTTNTAKDSILKNVVVSDKIPEGLDLDQSSVKAYGPDGKEITGAQVSYKGGQLVVSGLGDLKYNEHIKVVFTATVNEKAVGNNIVNVADVTGENPDGSTTGGNGTDSTPIPDYNDPKPEVKKSVKDLSNNNNLDKVRVGDDLEYTIDTTNTAKDSILKNVVVSDKIPNGLDIDLSSVKAYGPDGKEIAGAQVSYKDGQLVVSNLGDLKYNEHIKVVFTAKVNDKSVGQTIENIADVTGENPDGSTTGGNGTDSTPIPDYKDPKPEVKKSVKDLSNNNDLNKVRVGDDLEYTIDTTNTAKDSILKNVVVSDDIPEGLDLDQSSVKAYGPDGNEIAGAQVSYENGQLVVSGLGDLKYNEHIKVVFTAKVNEKAVGNVIENIADVTGENPDGSTTGGNGTDSTPVPDYNDPKPEVKKSVKDLTNGNDLNKVRVGDDLEYTIDTTNTAKDSILKNVVVSDKIPEGLDLDQSSVKAYGPDGKEITGAQVSYKDGQLVVSNLGDLKYNEHIKVVFTAKVNDKSVGQIIENIADVTGENPDGSTTGGNGTDSTPIPDYKDPKPEVKKSVKDLSNGNDLDKVRVGDTLQYTITATNTAKDSIWKNVVVNDQLPSELDFNNDVKVYLDGKDITSDVTVGYSNGVLTVMNIGDLKYNQQVKVVFTEQVTSRATGKEVVNIAEATGNNPDGSITGDHDSTVTPQNPGDPNNPCDPSDPGYPGSNGNNGGGSDSGITGLLPQTGEARDAMLVIIGLIVLSTVSLIVYFKKKSEQTM